jgi:hypothetical protein
MAVLCEAISVVVRRDAIDAYYVGGWDHFMKSVPNATLCTDGELARVGFLKPDDIREFVENLVDSGLQFEPKIKLLGLFGSGRNQTDIVVVDKHQGATMPCAWIEFGKFKLSEHDIEVSMCWLFEGERVASGIHLKEQNMELATPIGWSPVDSKGLVFKDEESS